MRKLFLAVFIGITLLVSSAAFAQQEAMLGPPIGGKKPGPMMKRGGQGDPLMQLAVFSKMLDDMDITDQQLTQIRAIFRKSHDRVKEMREEMKENHKMMKDALEGSKDAKDFAGIAAKQGEMTQKMVLARLETHAEIRKVLTTEQLKNLSDRKGARGRGVRAPSRGFPYRSGQNSSESQGKSLPDHR